MGRIPRFPTLTIASPLTLRSKFDNVTQKANLSDRMLIMSLGLVYIYFFFSLNSIFVCLNIFEGLYGASIQDTSSCYETWSLHKANFPVIENQKEILLK